MSDTHVSASIMYKGSSNLVCRRSSLKAPLPCGDLLSLGLRSVGTGTTCWPNCRLTKAWLATCCSKLMLGCTHKIAC